MYKKLKKLLKHPKEFIQDSYFKHVTFNKLSDVKVLHTQIADFVSDYDVNSMKVGSEYIWPYIRHHFWSNINSISIGQYSDYQLKPYRIQGGHKRQISSHHRRYLIQRYNAIYLDNKEKLEQANILFFVMQNAVEKQYVDDLIYHKFIDPYYAAAQNITTAQKFEVIRTQNLADDWEEYAYPAKLLLLPKDVQKHYVSEFKYEPNFFPKMKQHVPLLKTLTPTQLHDLVNYELATRDYYLKVLSAIQPKVIVLNYFHRYAPLISAADQLNILTIDLQHGLQKGGGMLYQNYPEVTSLDYQALPDYFAVWSEQNSALIKDTFSSVRKHKPIVMGNAWWQGFITNNLNPRFFQEKTTKNRKLVLLILQKQAHIPETFKSLVRNSSKEILWLVRHHPKGRRFAAKDFGSVDNVIVDDVLDKLIAQQLKIVDLTVSEGSALSIELRALGVPGVILSEDGRKNYRDEIARGILYFYESLPNDVEKMLEEINNQKTQNFDLYDNIQPQSFIIDLLKLSEKKRQ